MGLQNLLSKAKQLARGRKDQIDQGFDKAEQVISEKTGGKYDDKIKAAKDKVDETLTDDSTPTASSKPSTDEPTPEGTTDTAADTPNTEETGQNKNDPQNP